MNTQDKEPKTVSSKTTTAFALVVSLALTGCATSNFDFDAVGDAEGHERAALMLRELTDRSHRDSDEELYDISVIPLVHSRLNVFAESEDEDYPGGFVEADVSASLPLFGVVDATVSRFDADLQPYERHDYNSYLWGLAQWHREQVETTVGLREERMFRLLWLFTWRSSPEYGEPAADAAPSEGESPGGGG